MKIDVFNTENKKVEEIEIDDKILDVKVKDDLVHNVLLAYLNNQHIGSANTKTRGEVSGGGKKPWKQKGTGRARHGSIRSPIWKGGGVTFGPRAHKVRFKVNKKESQNALKAILSKRIKNNQITLLNEINITEPKTKVLFNILKNFIINKNKNLLIVDKMDDVLKKASRNIDCLKVVNSENLNTYDFFIADNVLITKDAIEKLLKRLN
jgi:large subunit ribosomal protein L4